MPTSAQTHQTLLEQATSPLQTQILLWQLQLLRKLDRQGRSSPEATLTLLIVLLFVATGFAVGFALAAFSDPILALSLNTL